MKKEQDNEAIKDSQNVNAEKKNKESNVDDDLPGYPHYPSNEDILNPSRDMKRVDLDLENLSRSRNLSPLQQQPAPSVPGNDMEQPIPDDLAEEEDDLGIVPGTEADVTPEDLILLGDKDRDMDMGEDEELQGKGFPLSLTGADLDVPGDEMDDLQEEIGEEDEENNYYSLGGDDKDTLEDPA